MWRAVLFAAFAVSIGVPAVPVPAHAAPVARTPVEDPFDSFIADASQRFDIPATWIRAVLRAESGGRRDAVSAKGAMGLMQIMPETWAELRDRYGLGRDPFDVHDNILAGAAFLREMHDRYGSPGFLAAYNAGPGRYEDYRDRGRPLPSETLAYVAQLLPLLGGNAGAMPLPAAAPDTLLWAGAPIFVMRSMRRLAVDHAISGPLPIDAHGVILVRDLSAIVPRSAGLFVAISAAGSKP